MVHIMSAGTDITHSEYNDSGTEDVRFLQIWVLPKERDITPRYDQIRFDPVQRKNQFQLLVSPDGVEGSMWMNQDGYFSMIDLDINGTANYQLHNKNNGVYLFPDKHTLPTKPEPYNVRYGPRGASEVSVYFS